MSSFNCMWYWIQGRTKTEEQSGRIVAWVYSDLMVKVQMTEKPLNEFCFKNKVYS